MKSKNVILMKISISLLSLFICANAQAAQIACWSLWDRAGARPAFTAEAQGDSQLANIRMLTNTGVFGEFDISDVVASAEGIKITSKRSPYEGNQEFQLTPDGNIRIILPMDLNSGSLNTAIIKGGNLPENLAKRQNGVIEVAGSRHHSGGSIFIRMHCTSKK